MQLITGTAVAAVMVFTIVNAWPKATCLTSHDDWRPDPIAAAALLSARPSGRIVVTFDWGEYVIWHLGPRLRVSFDPRFDLVYSPAVIAEQSAVSGAEHVDALSSALARFGALVRDGIDQADDAGDKGTADLFTEISREIDKYLWFVEAHQQK